MNGTGTRTNGSSDSFGGLVQSISESEVPTRPTTVSGSTHLVHSLKGCGICNMVYAVEG